MSNHNHHLSRYHCPSSECLWQPPCLSPFNVRSSLYSLSFSKYKSNHSFTHTHPCLKAFSGFPYVLWSWSKYLIWPKKPFGIYPSFSLQPQLVLAFLWVSASQTFICKKAPYSLLYEVFAQTFLWPESSFSPLPFATWLLASSSSFRTQSWLLNLRELFHDSAQEYKILCFNTATQQASLFQNL